jgi:hypothetical protein
MRSLLALFAVVGCTKPDPAAIVSPLESTLGAAVPAAYFAAVSMAALGGRPSPCTNVANSGSNVHVDVSLGASCPPMYGAGESGTVVVTGTWTPQLATFVMDFTGVSSDSQELYVVGIGSMTVAPTSGGHLVIGYGEEDILIGTGTATGAGIQQVVWAVDVDTAGTDDPSDDTIAVSGGDQTLLASSDSHAAVGITQVAVGDAVFDPGCRKNPNSGIAAVQAASTKGAGWVLFHFHTACDGTADVAAALAPYTPLITDSLPLEFLQH